MPSLLRLNNGRTEDQARSIVSSTVVPPGPAQASQLFEQGSPQPALVPPSRGWRPRRRSSRRTGSSARRSRSESRALSSGPRFSRKMAVQSPVSAAATRVPSRKAPAASGSHSAGTDGRQGAGQRVGQVARIREDLVVLRRPHLEHATADTRPESPRPDGAAPAASWRWASGRTAGRRRDRHGRGPRPAAPIRRSDAPRRRPRQSAAGARRASTICRLELPASVIRTFGRRRLGASAHVLDHAVNRRADDHHLGRSRPHREGRSSPGRWPLAAPPLRATPASRPTPITSAASPRERKASPTDPPISPTPRIATVPNCSKARTSTRRFGATRSNRHGSA